MKNIRTREQFEAAAQDLVGLNIAGVTYFEIQYATEERCYLHQSRIGHFLDFGLELRMSDGQFRSFLWDHTFYQYGIGIFPHQAKLEVDTYHQWTVGGTSEWASFIGSTIEAVQVYWSWVSESVADEEAFCTCYPQDMKLSFSNGRHIYISASQHMDSSDTLFGMSDEILVVFDESVATKYLIGPHAKNK
ncbi:hypothetical protein N9Y42_01740 [Mariniblastus sp.]|nr:hypothetical protein [Mariniblastus sp.]